MIVKQYYHRIKLHQWRQLKLLLLMIVACVTPMLLVAQVEQNQAVTSNGAGLVSGGNYTGYISAGQIATYMYANSSVIATQGIILNEIGTTVEFTFELSGSLTDNQDALVAELVLKSAKSELEGSALATTWIYLVLVSDSTVFDSVQTELNGDFVFSNVPYLDFFFMVGSPIITPEFQPVVLAFEENPVFVKEVEIFGEVGANGEISSTNVVVTPQLTTISENEEDLVFWYRDADNDGFGDKNNLVKLNANAQQAGYVANSLDCNDKDSTMNPAIIDMPGSGIDANCDGIFVWYFDFDMDGFGSELLDSSLVDTAVVRQSDNNLDCNDTNPFINPDAVDPTDGSYDANCDGVFGCDGIESAEINAPLDPIQLGQGVNLEASIIGSNPFSAIWDWGDRTLSDGEITDGIINGEHLYDSAGVYVINLSLSDSCGEVYNYIYKYVVIYDPDGGFVTGSGLIYSPPGASVIFPNAEGVASFGFVSKYDKKKGIPKGNTEFEFDAGELEFVSSEYEWLVVAGAKAKFKGRGSVNGGPGYQFMISAIDGDLKAKGDPDLFRIKIWNESSGEVVYDNEMGLGLDQDPSTAIMKGSIVVHVPKVKNKSTTINTNATLFGDISVDAYPNPTTGKLNLNINSEYISDVSVIITNISGQRIFESNYKESRIIELDLSGNTSGLYFVNVQVGNQHFIHKIVVKNP